MERMDQCEKVAYDYASSEKSVGHWYAGMLAPPRSKALKMHGAMGSEFVDRVH